MNKIFDITDYGAVGDGKALNTAAVQKAIDECGEGDTVLIPKGRFLSGAIFLKGDMTLEIQKGATLVGSENLEDYPIVQSRWEGIEGARYASLVNMKEGKHENLIITGEGTFDASGAVLRKKEQSEGKGAPGSTACISNTCNLVITKATFRNCPSWCVHILYCNNVIIKDIEVHSKYDENGKEYGVCNCDGIDIDSCKSVMITNSLIESQDDCIAIKSGKDADGRRVGIATEDVLIRYCRFEHGFGVAVGSEMSGGVRDVVVRNCDFHDSFSIGSIKAPRGRGGVVEDIVYVNCTLVNKDTAHKDCRWFRGGIYIDQYYSHDEFDINEYREINEGTAVIRNILFKDIELETVGGNAIYLSGLAESRLQNIMLMNVKAKGVHGMKVYNIDGLTVHNTEVVSEKGDGVTAENVVGVYNA